MAKITDIVNSIIAKINLHTTKLSGIEDGATADQTKEDIDALGIDAATVNGLTVETAVPAGAVFTDTLTSLTLVGNILTYIDENGVSVQHDLSLYLDDTNLARLVSGVYDPDTQSLIFTRDDATTFSVDASMFFDDTNLVLSVNGATGIVILTADDVGLDQVDNTSDLDKPISTATQTALDAKAPQSTTYTKTEVDIKLNTKQATLTFDTAPTNGSTNPVTSDGVYDALALKVPTSRTINNKALSANITLTKADVGLSNVDNTSDLAKPISTATQTALNGKLGSTENAVSASKLATARTIGGVSFDGSTNINLPGVNITGNQNTTGNAATATKLATARTINGVSFDGTANITVVDNTKAPISSPALTGTPTAPTPAAGDNSTKIATTEFVQTNASTSAISSTAQAQAGTDDTTAISPLKLREGLNASGTAPIYACRAWVNFNGTGTVAIRASGNVSSITDNGTGNYTVNFITAMPDTNYSAVGSSANQNINAGNSNCAIGIKSNSSIGINIYKSDFVTTDAEMVSIQIAR